MSPSSVLLETSLREADLVMSARPLRKLAIAANRFGAT
jgi:hypothetical protein